MTKCIEDNFEVYMPMSDKWFAQSGQGFARLGNGKAISMAHTQLSINHISLLNEELETLNQEITITVDRLLPNGGNLGVIGRFNKDSGAGYSCEINPATGNIFFRSIVGNQPLIILGSLESVVLPGGPFELNVRMIDDDFVAYINGELVIERTETQPPPYFTPGNSVGLIGNKSQESEHESPVLEQFEACDYVVSV